MAYAIYSSKPSQGGKTELTHVFFGDTEEEAWAKLEAHADICPKFGPAYEASETIETVVEGVDIPDFDKDAIDEFFELEGDADEDGDGE